MYELRKKTLCVYIYAHHGKLFINRRELLGNKNLDLHKSMYVNMYSCFTPNSQKLKKKSRCPSTDEELKCCIPIAWNIL